MISLQTLGTAEIDTGRLRILPTSPRKFALLFYLAAERGRRVPRTTLQHLLFPDQPERNARHSLRELLYQLRRSGLRLESGLDSLQVATDDVVSDFDVFVGAARLTRDQLRAAENGYLPGYSPETSDGFGEWMESHRARAVFELSKALIAEIGRSRSVGDWRHAELAARACLRLDRFNEEATLALAEALAACGSKAQAVDLLDQYIGEVGERSTDLKLPASTLRRRIVERPRAHSGLVTSPFIGRDVEMALLNEALAGSQQGHRRSVAIVGQAGIGKTRLLDEFCTLGAFNGASVLLASPEPHDIHRPFGLFTDLLKKLIGLPGAIGVSPHSMSLLARLTADPPSSPDTFDDSLVDIASFSQEITRALIDLFDAVASEGPLVLGIDDAPSLDPMSLEVLQYLLSGRKARRLFLVLTARDARFAQSLPNDGLMLLQLGGLGGASLASFIETFAAYEHITIDQPLSQWLKDVSDGNPLFLESLLAHYAATGERFAISPTLSSLLRLRIGSLSERALATLQMCALLGKFASLDTIVEATQLTRFAIGRAIAELDAGRLVRATGQMIRPAHALVGEIVQECLSPIERDLTHQYAALALERQSLHEPSSALVWACAEHWLAAGNPARALAAIHRCAAHALEIGLPGEAARMLARATELDIDVAQLEAVALQLVAAADVALDNELVLAGVDLLRRTGRALHHDDTEFAELRACMRLFYNAPEQEAKLLRCAAAETASPDHRVSAATQLLKYADNVLDRALAKRTMSALSDEVLEAATDIIGLEYRVLKHTVLYDFEKAATTARTILRTCASLRPAKRLSLTINAIGALYRSGFAAEAVFTAEQCYDQTADSGLPHLRLITAIFLADHYLDFMDDDRSAVWHRRIEGIIDAYPGLANDFLGHIHQLGRSLSLSDVAATRNLFDRLEEAGAFEGGPVRKRWRRVTLLRIEQMDGAAEMADADLDELMAAARDAFVAGAVSDMEAATVCHALLGRGKAPEAREFYQTFTERNRASRAPLSRCLLEARKEIERRGTQAH